MKFVFFDCDGMLVDSVYFIYEVMVCMFWYFDLDELMVVLMYLIIGLMFDSVIVCMCGFDVVDVQVVVMMVYYKLIFGVMWVEVGFYELFFFGIDGVIVDLLLQDDLIFGVVIGKLWCGLQMVCEMYGWMEIFFVVCIVDDCLFKLYFVMVLECCDVIGIFFFEIIVIGDSIYDMEMVKVVGSYVFGVFWGYGVVDDLKCVGVDWIVDVVIDIFQLIC